MGIIETKEQAEIRHQIEFAEERARLAVDSADMGTFDLNLETGKIITSPRFDAIFDLTEATEHRNYVAVIHPDDLHIRNKAHTDALANGRLSYEVRILGADQTVRWIKAAGKVYYDAQGKPQRMLGTILDVTQQKNAEAELNLSLEKFRLLADSIPQFIWTGDPEGNLNYYNQSVFDYSGLTAEQLKNDGWLQILHPDDREANMEKWVHSITTGENFLCEHRFRRHDGTYRWQLSRALPQKDSNGMIQMWVGTSTDIHDRKLFTEELEEKVNERTKDLKEANFRLERSNAELEQFAYVASHDLQEPLRKIKAFGDMLKNRFAAVLSTEGVDMIERMQSASVRMRILIDDLLSFSRVSANNKPYELVDINKLVPEVLNDMETTIKDKRAVIKINKLLPVHADALQLRQLFQNIISNSLKFTRPDISPVIHIDSETVTGEESGLKVSQEDLSRKFQYIHIKDNGIGFEQEYAERVFQIFQRLHGRSEYPGTGMGLSIVQKVVENHHGYIRATSSPGEGTTMDILLPAAI